MSCFCDCYDLTQHFRVFVDFSWDKVASKTSKLMTLQQTTEAREVRVWGSTDPPKIWDWGQKIDISVMSNRWFLTLTPLLKNGSREPDRLLNMYYILDLPQRRPVTESVY